MASRVLYSSDTHFCSSRFSAHCWDESSCRPFFCIPGNLQPWRCKLRASKMRTKMGRARLCVVAARLGSGSKCWSELFIWWPRNSPQTDMTTRQWPAQCRRSGFQLRWPQFFWLGTEVRILMHRRNPVLYPEPAGELRLRICWMAHHWKYLGRSWLPKFRRQWLSGIPRQIQSEDRASLEKSVQHASQSLTFVKNGATFGNFQ